MQGYAECCAENRWPLFSPHLVPPVFPQTVQQFWKESICQVETLKTLLTVSL